MRAPLRLAAVGLAAGAAIGGAVASYPGPGSSATGLAVRTTRGWETWWRSDAAPSRWDGSAELAGHISWRPGVAGIEWGELLLQGSSEARRTRVIVVRLDPRRITLSLVTAFTGNESWTIAKADPGAALALDAGQFRHALPWGWLVSGGKELLSPEYAPLAGAVVMDSSGAVQIIAQDRVALERRRGLAREAFQSYPMLLQDGAVPLPILVPGSGVDLHHRDARLALGTLADGRVVVALTRFDLLGTSLGRLPFGLTTPEMAAVMGALGCRDALLLDGGISGQLLVRG
jgi:exopolysaccharide biosynthesis protein